jgi:TPR repeat protein
MTSQKWKEILQLAKKGNSDAQFEIGNYFEDGLQIENKELVKVDKTKALKWFKKAHKKGNVNASVRYADYLSEGINCKKNLDLAIRLYKESIKKDSYLAKLNLAKTYSQMANFKAAFKLYNQIKIEKETILIELAYCYYFGLGTKTDKKTAFKLFKYISKDTSKNRSYEYEKNESDFYLGLIYLKGDAVKKSIKKAQKHLRLANKDNDHKSASDLLLMIGK